MLLSRSLATILFAAVALLNNFSQAHAEHVLGMPSESDWTESFLESIPSNEESEYGRYCGGKGMVSCEYRIWNHVAKCEPVYKDGKCYIDTVKKVWTELESERNREKCPKGCPVEVPRCPAILDGWARTNSGLEELIEGGYSDEKSCLLFASRVCHLMFWASDSYWVTRENILYSCETGELSLPSELPLGK